MHDPPNGGTSTGETKSTPIEDIGLLILDHQQITMTQALLTKLLANNTGSLTCMFTAFQTTCRPALRKVF